MSIPPEVTHTQGPGLDNSTAEPLTSQKTALQSAVCCHANLAAGGFRNLAHMHTGEPLVPCEARISSLSHTSTHCSVFDRVEHHVALLC